MLFLAVLFSVAIFLTVCFFILNTQAQEVLKREKDLYEKLWDRTNRLPLLIEVVSRSNIPKSSIREIITVRSQVCSSIFIDERVKLEKELSRLISDLLQMSEQLKELESDVLFVALKKEFMELLESIRIGINDYNFSIQKWGQYCRMPWYRIFEFVFEARTKRVLAVF